MRSLPLQLVILSVCAVAAFLVTSISFFPTTSNFSAYRFQRVPVNVEQILSQCTALRIYPGPPSSFSSRSISDRFEPGTNPTLIKNANILTGGKNGSETIAGDIFFEGGLVKAIGKIPAQILVDAYNLTVVDAEHAWVTPGLVDLHSHLGLLSAPVTAGTMDLSSFHGPTLPWLRSIDGFNTHDEASQLAIAGGVTSAQIVPGSSNAIGGQAFVVKLRRTSEGSPTSMIVEPPHNLGGSDPHSGSHLRWRHLKQACGENLSGYGTRMDSMWWLRQAYNEAHRIKQAQDEFCRKAEAGHWNDILGQAFPESLQWEALVDVLRGRVKISNHCYEAVDLDNVVRLSNEFQFPIASIHHASEAYLVPDLLKRTWGGVPTIALFTTNHRFKREAYRGSEFAPRVLADHGFPVVIKSDHPVINSRYLMYEAQQAHYYGLSSNLALASVTSTPAQAAGLSHRIGILQKGADADVVLWDSHPLQLGASPQQVWIDGIPQLELVNQEPSYAVLVGKKKENERQEMPQVPSWDEERQAAVKWEGLPPLGPKRVIKERVVVKNVKDVWMRGKRGVEEKWASKAGELAGTVVLVNGSVVCIGEGEACLENIGSDGAVETVVDLHGGSIGPGLMTFGSPLGVEEITGEPSTGDGGKYNPYLQEIPKIMGDSGGLVRTVDALTFGTRNALTAHRAGVTYATSSFEHPTLYLGPTNLLAGLATTFRTGADHALEPNAILKQVTALHIVIRRQIAYIVNPPGASISTQIATVRRLLLGREGNKTETGYWFDQAAQGEIPLIIEVYGADIMATLIQLKTEVEQKKGTRMKMVFSGATEAHLLAEELVKADVGVILIPSRPFPITWDDRRMLAGPPLTNETSITVLMKHGVTIAIGVTDSWQVGHTRFDVAWAALESNGRIRKHQQYELVITNLEKLLGIEGMIGEEGALVLYDGGIPFGFSGKPVGITSAQLGLVELH